MFLPVLLNKCLQFSFDTIKIWRAARQVHKLNSARFDLCDGKDVLSITSAEWSWPSAAVMEELLDEILESNTQQIPGIHMLEECLLCVRRQDLTSLLTTKLGNFDRCHAEGRPASRQQPDSFSPYALNVVRESAGTLRCWHVPRNIVPRYAKLEQ